MSRSGPAGCEQEEEKHAAALAEVEAVHATALQRAADEAERTLQRTSREYETEKAAALALQRQQARALMLPADATAAEVDTLRSAVDDLAGAQLEDLVWKWSPTHPSLRPIRSLRSSGLQSIHPTRVFDQSERSVLQA